MSKKILKVRRIKVGDTGKIKMTVTGNSYLVRVIEDRGNLGVNGEQVVRIESVGGVLGCSFEMPVNFIVWKKKKAKNANAK